MNEIVDVLIVGRIYSDLVFTGVHAPAPGTEVYADGFAISPGGAANRAVAAARLGATTNLLTEFGDDPIGTVVENMLRREPHLDLSGSTRRSNYQNPISVAITDGPDRSFVTYKLPGSQPDWTPGRPVRTAHVGLMDDGFPQWAVLLREAGTLLIGGVGWDPTGQWSRDLMDQFSDVDVLIVNEVEALGYTRAADCHEALRILASVVQVAVITLGPSGAIATDGNQTLYVPALPVVAVDPTGAGDTFTAAFMATTAWNWPLIDRLRLASVSATCSVRGRGGARSAPTASEIYDFLGQSHVNEDWAFVRTWAECTCTTTTQPA